MYLFEVWVFRWVIYKLFKQLKCFVGIWSRSSSSTLNLFLVAVTDTWEKWHLGGKRVSCCGLVFLFLGLFFPLIFRDSSPWLAVSLFLGHGQAKSSWWKGTEGNGNDQEAKREQAHVHLMFPSFIPSSLQMTRWCPYLQAGFLPFISFSGKALIDIPRTLHFTRLLSISQLTQVDHQKLITTYDKPVAHLTSVSHNWVSYFEWTVTLTQTLHYLLLPSHNCTNLSTD